MDLPTEDPGSGRMSVIYEESGGTRKDGNSERMANRIGPPANESKV